MCPQAGAYGKAEVDAAIATHKAVEAAHHTQYTDAEAIAAAKTDATLLNYTEGARVYHSFFQTIPDTTYTVIAFDSERYDTDAIHDPATNNSRLTCKTPGKYLIIATIEFLEEIYGHRIMLLMLNGAIPVSSLVLAQNVLGGWVGCNATIYDLVVDDYVEVWVYQDAGRALEVAAHANSSPEFMMQRIG